MTRHWTEFEDSWLRQVWPKTEIPSKAIAHALKRTIGAIRHRVSRLKIKRPWNGSPEHVRKLKQLNSSPEHVEHLKRVRATWNGSPKNLEALKRGRKKVQETWLGSPKHLEVLKRMQETWNGSRENLEVLEQARKKAHKTWLGSPEHKEHLKRLHETWLGSPENLEVLKRARAIKKVGAKPTWPEARFYGLVFGYDSLAEEFHAQELIPTTICNHTVDGRWRDVIFELDGGGHNAFIDRTKHDLLVDAEYQEMGYRVVREETASDLFLRFLQVSQRGQAISC